MLRAQVLLAVLGSVAGLAQATQARAHVSYVAEPATIEPGRARMIGVRFKVEDGFHVNSHRPSSELLLPTYLEVKPGGSAVKLSEPVYPKGQSYALPSFPEEKLDVYTGEFTILLPVTAGPGEHTLEGTLHYQACDRAACYPPKVLPVRIPVTAK
jgi:hypothetical protein